MEKLRVNAVFLGQLQKKIHQIRLTHIRPGNVYRNGQRGITGLLPPMQQNAGLLPDEPIQLVDKAVALEQGNELPGRHEAPLRMNPANQSLGTAQLAVAGPVFRL